MRESGVVSRACRNPAYHLGLCIGEADWRIGPDVTCALCYMVFFCRGWVSGVCRYQLSRYGRSGFALSVFCENGYGLKIEWRTVARAQVKWVVRIKVVYVWFLRDGFSIGLKTRASPHEKQIDCIIWNLSFFWCVLGFHPFCPNPFVSC